MIGSWDFLRSRQNKTPKMSSNLKGLFVILALSLSLIAFGAYLLGPKDKGDDGPIRPQIEPKKINEAPTPKQIHF